MNPAILFHPALQPLAVPARPINSAVPIKAPAAVAQPAMIHSSLNVATVNPNLLNLHLIWRGFGGQEAPRADFKLPVMISPIAAPTDQTLFQDPANATSQFYLPALAIATTSSEGHEANWVSLSPVAGKGFELTVNLTNATTAAVSGGRTSITATPAGQLQANLNGLLTTWNFSPTVVDGNNLTLTLAIPDPAGLEKVYQAMTNPAAAAKLVLQRAVNLALPLPPAAAVQAVPSPGVFHPPVATQPAAPPPQLYRSSNVVIQSDIPFSFDKDIDSNIFAKLQNVGASASGWNVVRVSWNARSYAYYQDPNEPTAIYYLPDSFKIGRQPTDPYRPSLIVATNGADANNTTLTLSFLALPVWDPNRLTAAAATLQQQLALDAPVVPGALFTASSQNIALSVNLPSSDPAVAPGLVAQPNALVSISAIQGAVTLGLAQFLQVYQALFDNVSSLLSGQVNVTVPTSNGPAVEPIPFISRVTDFAGDPFPVRTAAVSARGELTVTLQNIIESAIHVAGLQGFVIQGGNQIPFSSCAVAISPALPVDLAPAQAGPPATAGESLVVSIISNSGTPFDDSCQIIFDFSETSVVPVPATQAAIWQEIEQNQVISPISKEITFKLLPALLAPAAANPAIASGANTPGAATATAASSPGTTTPAPATNGTASSATSSAPTTVPSTPSATMTATGTSGVASQILAVQVVFKNGQTVNFDSSLTADASGFLVQKVSLAVPVEAYVLQTQIPDAYEYRVDQITAAGVVTGTWVTNNQDVVFLSLG